MGAFSSSENSEFDINLVDSFIESVRSGNFDEFHEILSSGLPVNAPGSAGYCALICAILYNQSEMIEAIMGIEGVEVNVKHTVDGRTPLMIVCQNLDNELVNILLLKSARVNDCDTESLWTALLHASFCNNLEALSALIEHGATINTIDCSNQTALHIACVRGHLGIVKALLEAGVDYQILDNEGNDALTLSDTEEIHDYLSDFIEAKTRKTEGIADESESKV